MSSLSIEVTPSTERALSVLDAEQRHAIELALTAQLARLIAPILSREEAVRELDRIAQQAESRALAYGLSLEALNRMIDESK
ncbi:MAG: hypothetical protein ACKN9T_00995 [Candidatus Methylumidiphilus sp.]